MNGGRPAARQPGGKSNRIGPNVAISQQHRLAKGQLAGAEIAIKDVADLINNQSSSGQPHEVKLVRADVHAAELNAGEARPALIEFGKKIESWVAGVDRRTSAQERMRLSRSSVVGQGS